MDTEAVERSIQEATASVRENVSTLESALLDIEEHTRYDAPRIWFEVVTLDHSPATNRVASTLETLVTRFDKACSMMEVCCAGASMVS